MSKSAASPTHYEVAPKQASSIIVKSIKARLTPMIHGSPAIGKSSIVHEVAEKFNLKVIDLRLSQCDPTDLLGFPTVTNGRASYTPMDTFPIEGDELPLKADGTTYDGWMLFLDELTSAPPAVQAAAYKLILDRMVGNHYLHKKVAIVGAGNLESDNAIVHPMSTALQTRMKHLHLRLSVEEWIEWAQSHGIDYRITSYINFKPSALYTFDPNHTDHTYSSPRTLEFASRTLSVCDGLNDPDLLPMLAGDISDGVATELLSFIRLENQLPRMADILANPTNVKMPDEPSVLFLLCGALGNFTKADNMSQISLFISRMPAEFQVVCLREVIRRDRTLMGHPAIQKWVSSAASKLF